MAGSSVSKSSWPGWVARDLALFAVLGAFGLASPWSRFSEQTPKSEQATRPSDSPAYASADEPPQSAKDREVARKIRRAVVTDRSLSVRAHNIKIIAKNGMVTLKGVVRSDHEKTAIAAKAIEIAGANNVKDEITVKPRG